MASALAGFYELSYIILSDGLAFLTPASHFFLPSKDPAGKPPKREGPQLLDDRQRSSPLLICESE